MWHCCHNYFICMFSHPFVQLKEMFPGFRLALPPKRWFKDNYDEEFLEERQIGLQTFLQNLTVHKDIISRCVCVLWWKEVRLISTPLQSFVWLGLLIIVFVSGAVRHFLCLVDPPSPFDSLEESRVSEWKRKPTTWATVKRGRKTPIKTSTDQFLILLK